MMYDALRKAITAQISDCTGWTVFFQRADDDEQRPYISYDLKEINTGEIDRHVYDLTVEFWDMDNPKQIIEARSKLDKRFKNKKVNNEALVASIYHGALSQMVEEDDKRVRHAVRSYEVIAYSKEGE